MNNPLKYIPLLLLIAFQAIASAANSPDTTAGRPPPLHVLFDDTHGQAFGNADWLIDGAFSDFADDLRTNVPARVTSVKSCSHCRSLRQSLLDACDILVIPEPNLRFSSNEIDMIRRFTESGGGLMLIADHGGSDRNMDGWDAGLIFNEITSPWNILFLGDTWSEAPVRGFVDTHHPVLKGIRRIGAWAASSILLTGGNPNVKPILSARATRLPYIIAGDIGAGRILAIGDSSPFDDGTGSDTEKNRHSSYASWLYDHRRFAVQAVAWLGHRTPVSVPQTAMPFPRTDFPMGIALRRPTLVIDAAHADSDADKLDRFGRHVRKNLKIAIKINMIPFTNLREWTVLVMSNPTDPLTEKEENQLIAWVSAGGGLLLAANNARNQLSGIPVINHLLERLGSRIRVNADEVIDRTQNTGKPWSVKVTDFPGLPAMPDGAGAVFWGGASLVDTAGAPLRDQPPDLKVLARTSGQARSRVFRFFKIKNGRELPAGYPIPVAAAERIGKGRLIVLGADTMTYFQYPTEEEKRHMDRAKWDHQTARFNLLLVKWLLNE